MLSVLEVRCFIRHLTGTAVIFLKLHAKFDEGFQVRSRQWHHLVDSEGMSSTYHVLDLY